jgi:hypothetical protein
MKRIIFFTLSLLIISTTGFAQIRIEKRHHGRGWYISTPGKNKTHKVKAAPEEQMAFVALKPVEVDSAIVAEETTVNNLQPASDSIRENKAEVQEALAKKVNIPKRVRHDIAEEVKSVPAFDVKKPLPTRNAIAKSQSETSMQAASGENRGEVISKAGDDVILIILLFVFSLLLILVFGFVALLMGLGSWMI